MPILHENLDYSEDKFIIIFSLLFRVRNPVKNTIDNLIKSPLLPP